MPMLNVSIALIAGVECSCCGNQQNLVVESMVEKAVDPDDPNGTITIAKWSNKSKVTCEKCWTTSTIKDFTFE